MASTILEVLENAEYNISKGNKEIGLEQLKNAIYLLDEKEKDPFDVFNSDDLKK
jgi:hypothetical protein